jgi:hypothetical protein
MSTMEKHYSASDIEARILVGLRAAKAIKGDRPRLNG